ncbi:NUDIX domain-containing protein [Butyrivibrio sp. MC2013]|uniref:NUDIX domain-containing protein n=1 Tax=Butyrivibrio sp. MC2013 TaxID=1280686 RepID=UPI00040BC4B0|nr:NUDIX hydrolase [Butyrivibrio sp. MC2013]
MYTPESEEEKAFLQSYDPGKYPRPSVTADIVVFTLNDSNKLCILLIRRGGFPYKGHWAIPGGFMEIDESIDQAAARELEEETSLKGLPISQFGTFGAVDRDPRTRVLSVAYMAFVPRKKLLIRAGDDAASADLFELKDTEDGMAFVSDRSIITERDLAFDHALVIRTARERLRNRIEYTDDAFSLVSDPSCFALSEMQKIYEAVLDRKLDTANFRRDFIRKYVNSGKVNAIGREERREGVSGRKPLMYARVR